METGGDKPPWKACGRAHCQGSEMHYAACTKYKFIAGSWKHVFYKYESWVEAISWFLRDSNAKRWKASTKGKCEEKINKELLVFTFYLPRGGKISKLILLLRNHFGADNPQTTSRSDFSTERNSNHFQNKLLCSDVLFSWIKMYALVFLHGVQRCSCFLSCLFVYE